jgi:hypothetical protein
LVKWRRRYLSWFARYGLRCTIAAALMWTMTLFVTAHDRRWWLAAACYAGTSISWYCALVLHDDPADPDDPGQDYF